MPKRLLIFLILAFSAFSLSIFTRPILAQDAIQCTPGDVNLNRNLKFVNPASNNIYLGSGKLNFSSGNDGLYATNDSGNLLLKSPANILFQTNSDFLFKNSDGTQTLAGIYSSGAPAAADNSRFLIVNGKIEGWQVNGLNQICVQGKCLTDWPTSCDSDQKLTASGSTFSCSDDTDTDTRCDASGTCSQLCIGTSCYNSWATAVQGGMGGTGTGVSKIIAGTGITISPASGEGDVTVSADGGGGGGIQTTTQLNDNISVFPYIYTYVGAKKPLFLIASIISYGGGNNRGLVDAQWLDSSNGIIRDWTSISGTNVSAGNDGGSGMSDQELATIPFYEGVTQIAFRRTGNTVIVNLIALVEGGAGAINSSSAPCASGFTRVGNECRISFGQEPLVQQITLCNSGDPSINNWATLDVPPLNGTNAVFAIVRSLCGENIMYIRESGSGIVTRDTTNELCYANNNITDWNRYTTGLRYIKLDGNKDFDWYNIGTDCGNNTMNAAIYLAGYVEN